METLFNDILPVAAVMILIGAMVLLGRKYSTRKDSHYDEMQLKIRADGYKYGFFVTLAGIFVMILLTDTTDLFQKTISPTFVLALIGFAGIVTFAVYCIANDAFYSIGQNRKAYIIICVMVVLVNGLSALAQLQNIPSGSDRLLFANCGNLLCALCFLIILIALVIKGMQERNEAGE